MPVDTARPARSRVTGTLETLMMRYQSADADAGGQLVDALSQQLFQFFFAQVRNRPDAEDLLQDFWLRMHNARATYRPGEPLLPWVYAIAHRTRIDGYRRRRRSNLHEVADDGALDSAAAAPAKQEQPLPDLLKELPASQREVLLMMKVSGLTLDEVARATGSSVGAVKQKAHRAYQTLRKLLGCPA